MAIIDVIKYEGGNDVLVWKHPKEDFNNGAQLIVHQSQEAIVFMNGQASQPYLPGKYTLDTNNIPGIRKLVEIVTDGVSPDHYDIYFVNKAYSLDVLWGTASPWVLHDPIFQMPFKLRAFGQFTVKVINSQLLMTKLVGTMTSFTQRSIRTYFRGVMMGRIKDCISNVMLSEQIGFTQISAYLMSITDAIQKQLQPVFEKYGLAIEDFAVESVNIIEDEYYSKIADAMATRAANVITGVTEQEKMGFDVAKTQAGNPGTSGQLSGIVAGVASGAAIGPAMGQITSTSVSAITNASKQNYRDPFSMGVIKKKEADKRVCADCGALIDENATFCSQCGKSLKKEQFIICSVCGMKIESEAKFCTKCGNKMKG